MFHLASQPLAMKVIRSHRSGSVKVNPQYHFGDDTRFNFQIIFFLLLY